MKKGFTLVELSIVLVIIGLLTGGVLAGQSLIFTSKINKLAKDTEQYLIAINTFKQIYGGLPGDGMPGFPAACAVGSGAQNGIIGNHPSVGAGCGAHEAGYVFSDLSTADMISERFTGCGYTPGITPGCHPTISYFSAPDGRTSPGLYVGNSHDFILQAGAVTYPLYRRQGNFIDLTTSWWGTGFLTPQQAQAVDRKFDDGQPGIGKITVSVYATNYNTNCVNGSTQDPGSTITWNASIKSNICHVQFWLDEN